MKRVYTVLGGIFVGVIAACTAVTATFLWVAGAFDSDPMGSGKGKPPQ